MRGIDEYFLIFGTKHIEGLKAMKEAMWKVDPTGAFRFSDVTNPAQLTLLGGEPDYAQRVELTTAFKDVPEVAIELIERMFSLRPPSAKLTTRGKYWRHWKRPESSK